jgi:hypothetical protein
MILQPHEGVDVTGFTVPEKMESLKRRSSGLLVVLSSFSMRKKDSIIFIRGAVSDFSTSVPRN